MFADLGHFSVRSVQVSLLHSMIFSMLGTSHKILIGSTFFLISLTRCKFNFFLLQISFSCLVFPSILSAYIGQAAYLSKFPQNVGNAFYASVPGKSLV